MKSLPLFFLLFFCNFQVSICQLPTEIADNIAQLEADNLIIASQFAPSIHQMTHRGPSKSVNGRADLITSVLYDDDSNDIFNSTNNWENLENYASGNPSGHDELDPIVYYSVLWSTKCWFITYAFYHPRDYALDFPLECCYGPAIGNTPGDNHENDLEGAIVVVTRSDNNVQGIATISHSDLHIYELSNPSNSTPDVMIDNGTHAVEMVVFSEQSISSAFNPCEDAISLSEPHIIYSLAPDQNNPFVEAENDGPFLSGTGGYKLEDIFGSHPNSLFNLKNEVNLFNGTNYFESAGTEDCQQYGSDASAPWGWTQMDYRFSTLDALIFEMGLASGPANLSIQHNPYHNECGDGRNYSVYSFPEEISYVQNYSSFRLTEGVELTIKDKVLRMDAGAPIILEEGSKLILDNSTITSCNFGTESHELWGGMFALESGDMATIEVKNNSIIENSQMGIANVDDVNVVNWLSGYTENIGGNLDIFVEDSEFRNNSFCITLANDDESESGNVKIENVSFQNNFGGIGFFGKDDGSLEIIESNFNDHGYCIRVVSNTVSATIEDNEFHDTDFNAFYGKSSNNISFERNVIENCSNAISLSDSYATIIDGNEFDNIGTAIYSGGTFPNSASVQIGSFDTETNEIANTNNFLSPVIRADGNDSPAGVEIINNYIINGDHSGISLLGANNSNVINNNIINSETGFWASATGSGNNSFSCNKFLNNDDQDMYLTGDNRNSKFLENNFIGLSSSTNINLENARVHMFQGSNAAPADNCFNDIVSADLNVTGISAQPFNYRYFETPSMNNCEIPETVGNYTRIPSPNPGIDNCPQGVGSNFFPPHFEPPGFTTLGFDVTLDCNGCFQDSINHYAALTVAAGGDDPFTAYDETTIQSENMYEVESNLNFWINAAIYYAIKMEDFSYGINTLQPLLKWEWQANLFGLYLLSGQSVTAETHLQGLTANNLNQTRFKEIQRINVKRWNSTNLPYQPTQAEIDTLYQITLEGLPSSGYASALYYVFTGNLIPLNISVPIANNKRSVSENEVDNNIRLYPNPGRGNFFIDETFSNQIENIKIYKANSVQVVFSREDYKNIDNKLDLSHLPSGVYFVKFTMENNSTKTSMLTIF